MDSPTRTSTSYSFADAVPRINKILSGADTSYEESDSIPDREKLTYRNGYYVKCAAFWIDIRESSKLPDKYRRPALAKLYRSYLSEIVAILHGSERCVEINIQGDAVWGVFDTPHKKHIDATFSTAVQCRSLIDVLNCRLVKHGYDEIRVGIGLDWGRALMIKAGYSGSGINDIVYMGDVVNTAAGLSDLGGKSTWDPPIVMSPVFRDNLNDHNQGLCKGPNYKGGGSYYTSTAVNTVMSDWIDDNC